MREDKVRAVLKAKAEAYTDQVVSAIRSLPQRCRLSENDSILQDVWEEFKFEVQREQSFAFEAYISTIQALCDQLVSGLPRHELSLLWLDSDAYWERDDESVPPSDSDLQRAVSHRVYQWVLERASEEPLPPRLLRLTISYDLPGACRDSTVRDFKDDDLDALSRCLSEKLPWLIDLFSEEDCFGVAEYDDPLELLGEAELELFRSALPPPERFLPAEELDPRDILRGYRKVIEARVGRRDINSIEQGLWLFNSIMEAALPVDESQPPHCRVELESVNDAED